MRQPQGMNENQEVQKTEEERLAQLIAELIEKDRDKFVEIVRKVLKDEIPPPKGALKTAVEGVAMRLLTSGIVYLIIKYGPVLIGAVASALLSETKGEPYEVTLPGGKDEDRDKISEEVNRIMREEGIKLQDEDSKIFAHSLSRVLDTARKEIKAELERKSGT